MKQCTILAFGFLVAWALPAGLAQDEAAEKLFRQTEKKIKEAKALEIVFTYQIDGKTAVTVHRTLRSVVYRAGEADILPQ